MYKLRIIAGPLRGNTYDMHDGENSVGRVGGNDVVLNTSKVSKKHCVLVLNSGVVTLKDSGSSNGTFVNGVLTTVKKVSPGDRISVGEHVLEVAKPLTIQKAPATVLPLRRPGAPTPAMPGMGGVMPGLPPLQAAAPPKDIVEKVKFAFDKHVINFLFTLNEKHEWNLILKGLLGILIVFSVGVSVFPTVQKTQDYMLLESRNRARALARLMVDRNHQAILRRAESELDISFAEREEAVVGAYIVDMDLRIMAPGKKLNQMLTEGQQGRFADNARKWFEKSERFFSMPRWDNEGNLDMTYPILEGNILGIAEPFKVVDPSKNQNVTVAFAVVFLDTNQLMMDESSVMVMFGVCIIFASIMGVAVFAAIHRLSTRPLSQLNEQVDKVLRGEAFVITMTAKMEEMEPLVQVINTALQKISGSGGMVQQAPSGNPDDFINAARFAAERATTPMLVLTGDQKVVFFNHAMEEVTGIRLEGNVGNDIVAASRDEAFTLMLKDLIGRAPTGAPEGVSDFLEFSGVNYQMEALGLGPMGGVALGYLLVMKLAA